MESPVDDDTTYCYWHSRVETGLSCVHCERPICIDCAVQAPVGLKCPDCARTTRRAQGRIPVANLARSAVAAVALAAGVGFLAVVVLVFASFFGLIIAWFVGMGVGAGVRAAGGGYRDPAVTRLAAGSAAAGYATPIVLDLITYGAAGVQGIGTAFAVLAMLIAAAAASRQASGA